VPSRDGGQTRLAELEEFVRDHHPHGEMTGDATAPAWNGLPADGGVLVWCGVRAVGHAGGRRQGPHALGVAELSDLLHERAGHRLGSDAWHATAAGGVGGVEENH
jgi:hypothetical protein